MLEALQIYDPHANPIQGPEVNSAIPIEYSGTPRNMASDAVKWDTKSAMADLDRGNLKVGFLNCIGAAILMGQLFTTRSWGSPQALLLVGILVGRPGEKEGTLTSRANSEKTLPLATRAKVWELV